jgi:hypothetical protein
MNILSIARVLLSLPGMRRRTLATVVGRLALLAVSGEAARRRRRRRRRPQPKPPKD